MGKLADKVALITGAGSGIGRATALLFAKEGAKIEVADFVPEGGPETVKMIKEAGGQVIFVEVNVSRSPDVQRMIHSALDAHGRPVVAALERKYPARWSYRLESWQNSFIGDPISNLLGATFGWFVVAYYRKHYWIWGSGEP